MNEAIGAFIVCAVLMTLAGATGWFERVMNKIPMALASALLAGVLARFGLQAFVAAQTALPLVLLMLGTYLLGKRLLPRYAVPLTLLVAIVFVAARGELAWGAVHFSVAVPVFTMIQQKACSLSVLPTGWKLPCSRGRKSFRSPLCANTQ